MKKNKTNPWTIVLLISLAILILMGLISSALEIGERLENVHVSLEILFYVLIAVVIAGWSTRWWRCPRIPFTICWGWPAPISP